LPEWFPGAGFKRNAAIWKKKMEEFADKPYEFALDNVAQGMYGQGDRSSAWLRRTHRHRKYPSKPTAEIVSIKIEPCQTVITVSHFLLAIFQHPEVLKQAQAEVDAVIGQNRLPVCEDRESLSYCDVIFSETGVEKYAWSLTYRLADIPIRLMEDDIYDNMFIPKG
ncbi:hypothetical protein PAXINDRAFT_30298, partial [Paxillus involutus ATCC 200175]